VLLSHALYVSVLGAVSGPGSRDFLSMDWSGGALVGTWVDLLLYCAGDPLAKCVMMNDDEGGGDLAGPSRAQGSVEGFVRTRAQGCC